jgi:hypothetical protein
MDLADEKKFDTHYMSISRMAALLPSGRIHVLVGDVFLPSA